MADIREVAKRANVSPSTVSRVLGGTTRVAEEKRARVLAAIDELDYRPNVSAQSLKGIRTRTIGLVIPNVRNLVLPAAIRGVEDVARNHGYAVVLCNTDEDSEKEQFYIKTLKSRLIDGFLFTTAKINSHNIKELQAEGFPVMLLLRELDEQSHAVVLDHYNGAYQATNYLLSRGLKKIGLVNGSLDIKLYNERYAGYRSALKEAGLKVPDEAVVHGIDGGIEAYRAATRILLNRVDIDAFFATSDDKALGVMRAIKDLGLSIPGDISVIGFDNADIALLLDPPLTTVAQSLYEMGAAACQQLIEMIEAHQPVPPQIQRFPAEVVIRNSVK
jgi:LacI family transcriptional regulator